MAVLTLALAGCGTLGTPDSATEQGNEVTSLWRPFVIIAIGIALLIWGLVAWSVVRYRRRDDAIPTSVRATCRSRSSTPASR